MEHNFTLSEVIDLMANKVSRDFGVTKKEAKKLIVEALCYNTVIAEIEDKINYLLNSEE